MTAGPTTSMNDIGKLRIVFGGTWTFSFPLMTSLLLSLVLTLVFWLIGRR